MTTVLVVVAGYLAGSIPTGYWIVRAWRGVDIRTLGSGNIGGTNVWRVFGRRYGVPVVLLDVAKGFAPALVGTLLVGHLAGVLVGGAAIWIVTFLLFRYASLASILAASSLPIAAAILGEPWPVIAFGALAAVAVVVLHRANIARLRAGTENRFRFGREAPAR